jgi:hypothetical protein
MKRNERVAAREGADLLDFWKSLISRMPASLDLVAIPRELEAREGAKR